MDNRMLKRSVLLLLYIIGVNGLCAQHELEKADSSVCYVEQPVTVRCGTFELPGVLTLPKAEAKAPVVVLVHGSGPNDRDETIGPNKPFRELAVGLAERGIATIRYDKRTKVYGAASVPEGSGMTLDVEVVDDVLAAVGLARTIPGIDPSRIYVLGHSLGAMLAPRIATREKGLAGIIMLSGNARPLEDLIIEQMEYLATLAPLAGNGNELEKVRKQIANVKRLGTGEFDPSVKLPFGTPVAYWKSLNDYRQTEVAKRLKLPMLILQGERDYQVTMEDYRLWQRALSGKKRVTFKSYPLLNHLYLEGEGKPNPTEYYTKGTIPAYVMDDIAAFVRVGGKQ